MRWYQYLSHRVWTLVPRLLYHCFSINSIVSLGSSDVFSSSKQDGGSGRLSISRTAAYFSIKFASKSAKPFHLSVNSALLSFSSTFLRNVLFLFSSGQNGIKKSPYPFRCELDSIQIRPTLLQKFLLSFFPYPSHFYCFFIFPLVFLFFRFFNKLACCLIFL